MTMSPSRVLLALILCCGAAAFWPPPLAAQSEAERADAVKEFRRFFRKFKEVSQKVEAVRTLEGMESADAVDELVGLLDYKEPDVAAAALDVLATYRQPESFQRHIDGLDGVSGTAQPRLVEVLGRAGIAAAAPRIVEVAGDARAGTELRYAAARALIALEDRERATELVGGWFDAGDPLVRMAAAETVGALRLAPLGEATIALLDDEAWQVRSAAIAALGSVRVQAAVVPLIDLMAEGGRFEEECADALFRITARDLGTDVETWRTIWARLTSIEGFRIPTDEELAKAEASRKRYDALYGNRDKPTTTFGGIPTTSTRILFIIDVSGSMADLVVEREKFDSGYADWEKLTIVKTELIRTIETLGDDVIFNVVAFATDLDAWKRRPVASNIVNRASAMRWIEKLEPIGGPDVQGAAGAAAQLAAGKTNTYKALMHAFGVDPDARRPATAEENAMSNEIDTVFFLSDGRPSVGKHTDVQRILDEVTAMNARFRMVFHTIAIGQFQKEFLRLLAEWNGGVFVDLGA